MIRIEITDESRECEVKGCFQDICVETVFALRSIIEAIEEVNIEAAAEFTLRLESICAIARINEKDVDTVAEFYQNC